MYDSDWSWDTSEFCINNPPLTVYGLYSGLYKISIDSISIICIDINYICILLRVSIENSGYSHPTESFPAKAPRTEKLTELVIAW